jgi:hypothetical protein
MTVFRMRGFKIFKSRHGKEYCYHRKTGERIDLTTAPIGSAEFMAECSRITALAKTVESKPGTLGMLIAAYRGHAAFLDLAPRTRSDYQRILDYLKPIADTPLVRFDRPLVVRIRDKAAVKGRRQANYVKAVLSILFAWGSERGFLANNPASEIKDIRRNKGTPDANRPWADEERDAVLDAAPAHMTPAVALMTYTGLGPKDALTLPKSFYRANEIATNRSKTGEPIFWPCPSPLMAPGGCAETRCDYAGGQLHRPSMDRERIQGVMAQGADASGARRQDRPGTDAVRIAAHRGGDPARDWIRRAHHCRRSRAKDD